MLPPVQIIIAPGETQLTHKPPSTTSKSFSCPHCGALAHQYWHEVFSKPLKEDGSPSFWTQTHLDNFEQELRAHSRRRENYPFERLMPSIKRQLSGLPEIVDLDKDGVWVNERVENLHFSVCFSCNEPAIWLHTGILWPRPRFGLQPNPDLPDDIRADFNEARDVASISPRAAAALLRLCIEKLCKHLGEKGKDINADIGALVEKGLPKRIQQALDIVRVIGNHAVHPGALDLRDDHATAATLFELVNLIAYDRITQPKEIDRIFEEKIPEKTKEGISQRDAPKH